jgi:hypothetical protein
MKKRNTHAEATEPIRAIQPLLTTRDLHEMTGRSMDYFQKLARSGLIPCKRLGYGSRAMFLFDRHEFDQWWHAHLREIEPCPAAHFAKGAKSGTAAFGAKAKNTKSLLKQEARRLLESVLADGSKN